MFDHISTPAQFIISEEIFEIELFWDKTGGVALDDPLRNLSWNIPGL